MSEGKSNSPSNNGPLSNRKIIILAWGITGGLKEKYKSPDIYVALFITLVCFPAWIRAGWWDMPLGIVPSLLGFTLSGFAIFLGFGSDTFKSFISDENHNKSEYLSVSSSFLIFVIFQVVTLVYAIISKSLYFPPPEILSFIEKFSDFLNPFFWFLGFFLMIYSIILGYRAALRIFRVSRWYNDFLVFEEEQKNNSNK